MSTVWLKYIRDMLLTEGLQECCVQLQNKQYHEYLNVITIL